MNCPKIRDVFQFLNDIMPTTSKIAVARVYERYFEEGVTEFATEEDYLWSSSASDESSLAEFTDFYLSEEYERFNQDFCRHIEKAYDSGEIPYYIDGSREYFLNDSAALNLASEACLKYINRCKPSVFEKVCTYLLFLEGFENVTKTSDSNDGGIDFFATKKLHKKIEGLDTSEVMIWGQAKRYGKTTVGIASIREMIGATEVIRCGGYRELPSNIKAPTVDYSKCKPFAAHARVFVTSGSFSKNAKTFAEWLGMRMIDGPELTRIFNHHEVGFIRDEESVIFNKTIFRKIIEVRAGQLY